ncbi:MAG: hypothetical protein A07HB70_00956 [uncultured archaeon A07HB70]|nr:MAG: hypothetical protein A07HB70_00956 [uncultured archaeon A07HB70]
MRDWGERRAVRRQTTLSLVAAVLVLGAGCAAGAPAADTESGASSDRQVAVAAAGVAESTADEAVVRLGVQATDDEVVSARRALAENVSRMREALVETGVDEADVTTTRYDIYRDRRREGEEPQVRYRAAHDVRVTVDDPDRVGTVIDTAVRNGATDVDGVEFTLSAARQERLDRTARQRAMRNAREKATQFAESENLTITGVRTVRTVDTGSRQRAVEAATPTAAPAGGAETELDAGPVSVTVRVEVVYDVREADGG